MACLLYGVIVTVRIPRLTGKWQWHWLIVPALFALFAVAYFSLLTGNDTGWKRFGAASALLVTVLLLGKVRKYRARGLKVLFWLGGPLVVAILTIQVIMDKGDRGPLWPLVLATMAFLYLWRLAALIFDLVFVWHLYIHSSVALKRMGEVVASPYACKQWEEAPSKKTKWIS